MKHQLEIERKFLVTSDEWRTLKLRSMVVEQGYLSDNPRILTRVRLIDDLFAYMTMKSKEAGISRSEWEHVIKPELARDLLELSCDRYISKIRHIVSYNGQEFEVDEFLGKNAGLIVAEIELQSEDQKVDMPDWLGDEVTHDRRYYNDDLSRTPFTEW